MSSQRCELPQTLVSDLKHGNVVLVLGAGASFGAMQASGIKPPIGGRHLARLLADKFLSSAYREWPLSQVADLAINENDLFTIQDYVASLLVGLKPSQEHLALSTFFWRGVATTNYDTLIEEAYRSSRSAAQSVVPMIDNDDRVDEAMRTPNALMLLKLHGCVTRTRSKGCPLLLSTDQFLRYERGRNRLFSQLKEWAAERPLLFVGYEVQDCSIRNIFEDLEKEVSSRPRHYLVLPELDSIRKRYWEGKKVTAIEGTIETLVAAMREEVTPAFRGIATSSPEGDAAAVAAHLRHGATLSRNATHFVERDVECVNAITRTQHMSPVMFYRGVSNSWAPIEQSLDVQRALTDSIIYDHIIDSGNELSTRPIKIVVVKAHAGAGKTVLLRRLAWEAAKEYKHLCFYVRPDGVINTGAILEILENSDRPVLLFVDHAIDRRRELERLHRECISAKGQLIVFCTARTNEWNQAPESLTGLADDECELEYLSKKEIRGLLQLLEQNDALGTLEDLLPEERVNALVERAGRQLLVALHEATLGEPLERIIADEYQGITPATARAIYLSVCLLNRFGVPVRAGIIARMHGVTFENFKEHFFAPLEQIIVVDQDRSSGDFRYSARHAHIAEVVIRVTLSTSEDLFNEVVRCVRVLNPMYSTDQIALQRLLQARAVLESFPDHQMALQLYELAQSVSGDDAFLYQQRCIYEMNRSSGNLDKASSFIDQAMKLASNSSTVHHTLAELRLRQAAACARPLERRKLLNDATEICNGLKRRENAAYAHYTLVKVGTLRIKDALLDNDTSEQAIESLIRETEKELKDGQQRFPENAPLRAVEAELAKVLSESDRVIDALKKAFALNNRNTYIAMRIADWHVSQERRESAVEIIRLALAAKPSDQRLHGFLGKLLIEGGSKESQVIAYHLKRAFSPGDSNHESRFLLARQLFIDGSVRESRALFEELKAVHMSSADKRTIRYPLENEFYGLVSRIEANYCLIRRDGDGESVHASRRSVDVDVWPLLSVGCRITFRIGFNMFGPSAMGVKRLS